MKKYSEIIQGLPGYSREDIIQILRPALAELEAEEDFRVKEVTVIGSRTRNQAKPDSDLDILVEYEGTMREDDAFNALNAEPIYIEGIQIDINPIRREESGTTQEWLDRSRKYLESI